MIKIQIGCQYCGSLNHGVQEIVISGDNLTSAEQAVKWAIFALAGIDADEEEEEKEEEEIPDIE